jgi:hexokinase
MFCSFIRDNTEDNFRRTHIVLEELGYDKEECSDHDCGNIQYICSVVSQRAAFLASAGIATLVNRIDKPMVTVAVDGSLYRFHPHFHTLMMEKTQELLNPGLKVCCSPAP